jgi:hypothetical protein
VGAGDAGDVAGVGGEVEEAVDGLRAYARGFILSPLRGWGGGRHRRHPHFYGLSCFEASAAISVLRAEFFEALAQSHFYGPMFLNHQPQSHFLRTEFFMDSIFPERRGSIRLYATHYLARV